MYLSAFADKSVSVNTIVGVCVAAPCLHNASPYKFCVAGVKIHKPTAQGSEADMEDIESTDIQRSPRPPETCEDRCRNSHTPQRRAVESPTGTNQKLRCRRLQ